MNLNALLCYILCGIVKIFIEKSTSSDQSGLTLQLVQFLVKYYINGAVVVFTGYYIVHV